MDEEVEERSKLFESGYEQGKNWVINNPELFGLNKLIPLNEDAHNKLIKDLQRVDHHQVSEEIWRIKDYFAKYGQLKRTGGN